MTAPRPAQAPPVFDRYTWQARIQPALWAVLPLAAPAYLVTRASLGSLVWLWGLLLTSGLAYAASLLSRELGVGRQDALYRGWGGKPTTRMLRLEGAQNPVQVAQWHRILSRLTPGIPPPTVLDERANPGAADNVYDTWVGILRERTRDKRAFPLVFEENCGYGFRRNCWGMRPIGVACSLAGMCVVAARLVIAWRSGGGLQVDEMAVGFVDLLALLLWWYGVDAAWVKTGADAYARQLLASTDAFDQGE